MHPRINLNLLGFVTFFGNAIKTSSAVGLSALRHESHLPGESWVDEYGEGAPTATPVGRDLILTYMPHANPRQPTLNPR